MEMFIQTLIATIIKVKITEETTIIKVKILDETISIMTHNTIVYKYIEELVYSSGFLNVVQSILLNCCHQRVRMHC